jgi:hypothetical protein
VPFQRTVQRPAAARTLRTQSVSRPQGKAMTKVVSIAMTARGTAYSLPVLRPRCFSTTHSGRNGAR